MSTGNDPLRNNAQALAAHNIGLAKIIAKRFHATLPELDYDDLASEATRALVKAAEAFDLNKSKFSTYAAVVIENRLCDVYDKQKRYRKIFDLTSDDSLSFAAAQGDTDERPQELIPTPEVDPARQTHRNELSRDIAAMVKGLEGNQKAVIEGIMNGDSYQTIADRLGVSKQAVQQMAKRFFSPMKERLTIDYGSNVQFMPNPEPWEEDSKKSLWMKIVSFFKST